jgi:flagellar biosynthetic protein FliR
MNFTLPVEFSYLFMLIFARAGSLLMVLPMIGERVVPMRMRLVFALFLTLILLNTVKPSFGRLFADPTLAFGLLIVEVLIGLGIGTAIRFLLAAADMASQLISQSLGMQLGETFNPSFNAQSPVIGTMLTLLLIVTMFELNVHHALIAAIAGSYEAVPPGVFYPLGDFSQFGIRMVTQSFVITLQISAPFILFGILFNFGLGILSRLVPQLQVMFVATPLSILAGLGVLALLLGLIIDRLAKDVMTAFSALAGG